MEKIKSIIYTAGVVKNNEELIKNIPEKYQNIFVHHMTIQYGNFEGIQLPEYVGKNFTFIATKMFSDDNAIALTGYITNREIKKLMKGINQKAHITIATANDTKPVYSNELIRTKSFVKIDNIKIKMQAGAFVVVEDNSTKWIFQK